MAPNNNDGNTHSTDSREDMNMDTLRKWYENVSQQQTVGTSGGQQPISGSTVDHLFRDWLPRLLEEKKHLVDVIKSVYQWNITRNSQIVSVWTLDLKSTGGAIYAGAAKVKPDCCITIDEEASLGMFTGTLDPAKAFMGQKMKIQGNLMAAHKFQQFWAEEALHGSLRHLNERLVLGSGSDGNSGSAGGEGGGQREEALLASIPVDGLKSDIVFNTIRTRLSEEPDLVKAMRFVIQFNITRNGKVVAVWTTDTKVDGGEVYRSAPKVKPDAIVNVDDENYVRILFGQLNPQRAFMTGKISVKGNILLLQKLDSFWNQVQGQRKDPEMPQVKDIMLKDPMKPGLKSEVIIFDLIQKLVRLPNLLSEGSTVRFDIKKDGQLASKWKLSFPLGANGLGRIERADNTSGADDNTLTVDDNDFVRLTYSTLKLEDAIASGRVKYSGDPSSVAKLSKMFNTSIIKAKL